MLSQLAEALCRIFHAIFVVPPEVGRNGDDARERSHRREHGCCTPSPFTVFDQALQLGYANAELVQLLNGLLQRLRSSTDAVLKLRNVTARFCKIFILCACCSFKLRNIVLHTTATVHFFGGRSGVLPREGLCVVGSSFKFKHLRHRISIVLVGHELWTGSPLERGVGSLNQVINAETKRWREQLKGLTRRNPPLEDARDRGALGTGSLGQPRLATTVRMSGCEKFMKPIAKEYDFRHSRICVAVSTDARWIRMSRALPLATIGQRAT